MPATVELSVPPLRKQAGLLPSSWSATASRIRRLNVSFSAPGSNGPASSKVGTQ